MVKDGINHFAFTMIIISMIVVIMIIIVIQEPGAIWRNSATRH
jgi:hypothetical protein